MISIRSVGLFMLLSYASYNVLNILFFHNAISTLYFLLAISFSYFILRVVVETNRRSGITQGEFLSLLLLFFIVVTVITQNIAHKTHISVDGVSSVDNITTITRISIMWFFIGGACSFFKFDESRYLALFISLSVAILMFAATGDQAAISFSEIAVSSGVERVSHLTLEKHVILLLVFSYAIAGNFRFLVLGLGVFGLFFMGGRTALFVFLMAAILMNFRGQFFRNTLITVVFVGLGAALFWFTVATGGIDLQDSAVRDILFLDGLEEDNSFSARRNLFMDSLPLLADQFWIGNYSLVSERHGSFSAYSHNLLSAWQFYGFFIFCFLILALWYSTRRMFVFSRSSDSPVNIFGSFMLVYVLLSVLLSKYVGWNLLWFALGFWMLRVPEQQKSRRKRKRSKKRRETQIWQ